MHTPSGQCCVHLYARILSMSFTSVSIFSVLCYSSVSISMYQTIQSTEAKFLDPDWGVKVENLLKCIYKNLRNFKQQTLIMICVIICIHTFTRWHTRPSQKDVGCMAAPSSSMAIVDFIPQSGTMNLATATNVVFYYFLYFSSSLQILQKD
jgi:hypothetical protein